MHWSDIASALRIAGVQNILLESYGMKGTLWAYKWLWEEDTVIETSRQTYVDLGDYVPCESNPMDIILLKHYRRFTVYSRPMLNDPK